MSPDSVQCRRRGRLGPVQLVVLAIIAALPEALGRSLRLRRQPAAFFPSSVAIAQPPLPPTSMLAFGGMAIKPMTAEEIESLPNPGDEVKVALSSATIGTLEASLQGSTLPEPPPLVEDGRDSPSSPAVDDAPAVDDDSTDIEDDTGEAAADSTERADHGLLDAKTRDLMPAAPIDMLARATQEVKRQTSQLGVEAPPAAIPLVSMKVCAKAAKELKAMSCSLVTQISGYPEGCECRMKAKKCPKARKDLGFTGVSPSLPLSPPQLKGVTVILCMYWQWLKPPDRSQENANAAHEAYNDAESLVNAAHIHAEEAAVKMATSLYAMTDPPFTFTTTYAVPTTPPPIYEPVRIWSTTPYMPTTPSMASLFGMFTTTGMLTTGGPNAALLASAEAATTLTTFVAAGATLLPTLANVGFLAGRQIIIDQPYEVNEIVGFGSITLKFPLKFNHPAGAYIIMQRIVGIGFGPGPAPGPAGPAFGPAPGPAPAR